MSTPLQKLRAEVITLFQFEQGRLLGTGSYSEIFLATRYCENKKYALKSVNKANAERKNMVKYVVNEKQVLEQLEHTNICNLVWTSRDKDCVYFIYEYAPNGELWEFLQKWPNKVLPYPIAKYWMAEVVNVIEYLQSKNIVHRDLKPENILLSENYHIKVCDFGTSKIVKKINKTNASAADAASSSPANAMGEEKSVATAVVVAKTKEGEAATSVPSKASLAVKAKGGESVRAPEDAKQEATAPTLPAAPITPRLPKKETPPPAVEYGPSEHEIISEEEHLIRQKAYKESRKKSFVGTPEYMAPEVVNNNPERGYAADLWALGVMIYQLATGKLPFKDNSDYLTFLKTLEGKFDIPADLDKNVIDIITRLLVANPSQRLGAGGKFEELRTHPYFEGVEWQKMTGDEDLPEKVTELILLHKQALHKQKGGVGGSDDDNDGRNEEGAYKGKTHEEMDVIEMLDHEFDAQARTIETVKEQTGYMLT